MNIEIEPSVRGWEQITFTVEHERVASWRAAARRCHLSLDEWLTLSIDIANHLSLIEGYLHMPSKGQALDPLLAEAIRRAAVGKPWEHKAMLLLQSPGLRPNPKSPAEPTPTTVEPGWRIPPGVQDLFARHGLPPRDRLPSGAVAYIGSRACTWRELAAVLAVYDNAGDGWCHLTDDLLARWTGFTLGAAKRALRSLRDNGLVVREELPTGRWGGARSRLRLLPHLCAALQGADFGWGQRQDLHILNAQQERHGRVVAPADADAQRDVVLARLAELNRRSVPSMPLPADDQTQQPVR